MTKDFEKDSEKVMRIIRGILRDLRWALLFKGWTDAALVRTAAAACEGLGLMIERGLWDIIFGNLYLSIEYRDTKGEKL